MAGWQPPRNTALPWNDLIKSTAPRPPTVFDSGPLEEEWSPVSGPVTVVAVVFIMWMLVRASSGDHWVPIIDNANLAFHEAGHLIVGLVSSRLSVYGGTLGQLVFPVAAAWQFMRRRHTLGFALCGAWACQSLLNVATYMGDARALQLPLIGGLDPATHHDWREIFSRWGMLELDTTWAALNRCIAWAGGVALSFWLVQRWHSSQPA